MKALWKLTLVDVKLYLREPTAAFFTIAFAPMMLLLFGSIYGNKPDPMFGGKGTMDVSVPAYIGIIIVTVGLMSIPIGTATAREKLILRRYQATPLRPWVYIAADIVSNYVMTLAGTVLLVVLGKAIYHVRFDGSWPIVFVAFTLSTLAFFALGYTVGGLSPTVRTAQTVGMVLAFPMMFLSGAAIPLEILPSTIRSVANFLPLTHVVTLTRGLWVGDAWSQHMTETVVLIATLIAGALISAETFRWE